jgi:protein tyrosine phosphatase
LEPLDDTPDSDYINASYVDVSKFGSVWTAFTCSLHKVLQLSAWWGAYTESC